MSPSLHTLHASPSVRRLLCCETAVLEPSLTGLVGAYGLHLSGHPAAVPSTPLLGCWAHLSLRGDIYEGSLHARADEALPFADDAFRVVVLSHVLEHVAHASYLLDEAMRVLAPGGLLAVTGFHPLSAWAPWLMLGDPRPRLAGPDWLRQRLACGGVQAYAVRRFGAAAPGLLATRGETWLGGGFVLLAHKRRAAVTPLRPRARVARVSRALVPGAHRECA